MLILWPKEELRLTKRHPRMHGTIFAELRQYTDVVLGPDAWKGVLEEADIERSAFELFRAYPDEEARRLVRALARRCDLPERQVLREFGRFIAKDLLRMYWGAVREGWRTLDVIEHAEASMHTVLRADQPTASPPYLAAERTADDRLVLEYNSSRRMCDLAKGIAEGLADHYGERIAITESTCMHEGDATCTLVIERLESL